MNKEVSANNKKLTFINDRIDPELITSISISTEKVNLYNYKGINVNKSKYDNKDLFAVDTNNFLLSEKDTSIEIYPTNKNVLIKNTNKIKKENIESYESILDKRLNLGSYLNDNDYNNFFQKAELPLLFNNNNENFITMNDFFSYKDPYTDENTYIEEENSNYSLVGFNKERNELADMAITINSDNAKFNWLTMNYSLSNNCLGDCITFTNSNIDSPLKPIEVKAETEASKEVKAKIDKENLSSEKKEDDKKFTFTLDKNMWYSNGELMNSNYYLDSFSTLLPTISLSSIHINMSDWWGIDQFDKYKINNYQSSWYSSPYSCSCSSCTCDGSNKYFDINIDTDKNIEVNKSYTQLLENDLFKNDSFKDNSLKNDFSENDSFKNNFAENDSLKDDSFKNDSLKNGSSKNDSWKDNLLKEFPFKNDLINLFKNNLVKYDSLEKFSLKNDLIKDNSLKNDYIKENYTIDSLAQKDNNSYKKPFNQEIREEINRVLQKYKINKKQLIEIIQ